MGIRNSRRMRQRIGLHTPRDRCYGHIRFVLLGDVMASKRNRQRHTTPINASLSSAGPFGPEPLARNDDSAHPAAALCFSRRRCTDEGMRIASRYLATVRRAISMPASRSFSTMVSSDKTSLAGSASINCLMRWRTASAECASPPWEAAIAEVKKYLSSKMPRLVAMYLLAVTRDNVDSWL